MLVLWVPRIVSVSSFWFKTQHRHWNVSIGPVIRKNPMLQLHEFHACIFFWWSKIRCVEKKHKMLSWSPLPCPAPNVCYGVIYGTGSKNHLPKGFHCYMMGETHHLHPPHHLFNRLDHPIASTIPSCRVYHRHSHRSVQRPGLFVGAKKTKLVPGFNKQRGFQPEKAKKNWKSARSARSRSIKQLRRCTLKQIRNPLSWLVVDHSGWGHSSENILCNFVGMSIPPFTKNTKGKGSPKNPG